jgi:hypothetical protein
MKATKRSILSAGIVLIALAMLFGCSLSPWDSAGQSGWYIKLEIGNPVAKGIDIEEYDVTGVNVKVYGPGDELLDTVDWAASEGSQSYLIPVSEAGLYGIEVTHVSDSGGEVVRASEYASFHIEAMTITVVSITPGCIGVIDVAGGSAEKEDGTLTVHLAGIGAPDGTRALVGVFPAGVDPMPDPMAVIVAVAGGDLMDGALTSTATVEGEQTVWAGAGGNRYDLYIWVDMNNNADTVMYPEPGVDLQLLSFPYVVEIDGDTDVYFEGSDFILVQDPP